MTPKAWPTSYLTCAEPATLHDFKFIIKQHENPIPCDQCSESFLTTGSLNEHKQVVHKDFKTKKKDLNDFSDIRLQEPLIITNQGLLQNAPRFSSVYNPTEGELMERQYHCNFVLNAASNL